jgi:orotate phosphoribosyltransferase
VIGSDTVARSRNAIDVAEDRQALADDLRRIGYLFGDLRGVDRGGGDCFFEKDLVLTRPALLERIALELTGELPPSCDRLAASNQASVALATTLSLRSGIPLLFIDPQIDRVVGDAFPDAEVVLVLDVILSGRRALEELAILRASGLLPIVALAMLDRAHGGRANVESSGTPVRAVFSEQDIVAS